MALSVNISGPSSISQGAMGTFTATVRDSNGNLVTSGLTYIWTPSRGSFVGTPGATAVYRANFSDANDVDVPIRCNVTRAANSNPTISASSLTAMADLGISGQLVNIHATDSNAVSANTNNIIFAEGGAGTTIETGSDLDLTTDLHIYRLRWDNRGGNTRLILNSNGTGNLNTYFSGNTAQSIYIIFQDGTYFEVDSAQYSAGSGSWARWVLTDQDLIDRLNAWDGSENLLIGIADAGSVGITQDSGSGTQTITVSAPVVRSIAMVAEQNIINSTDYRLRIRVTGNPDEVEAYGDFEFFSHYWDPTDQELNIVGTPQALVTGKKWRAVATWNDDPNNPLEREVTYNVVPAAPIITHPRRITFYKGFDYTENPIEIKIANNPGQANISGLLVGLGQQSGENGQEIIGEIHESVTVTEGTLDVETSNTGGEHIIPDVPFGVHEPNLYILHLLDGANFTPTIDVVDLLTENGQEATIDTNDRIDISSEVAITQVAGLALDREENEFYVLNLDVSNWKIDVFSTSGTHLREINLSASPINLTGRGYNGIALDKVNNHIYLAAFSTVVALDFNSPHTVQRTFTVSGDIRGMAFDANNNQLYLGNTSGAGRVSVVPANTANGATATVIKEWTFSESSLNSTRRHINGMTFDATGNFLFGGFTEGGAITDIAVWKPSEISDGAAASAVRIFDVPSSMATFLRGLAA